MIHISNLMTDVTSSLTLSYYHNGTLWLWPGEQWAVALLTVM